MSHEKWRCDVNQATGTASTCSHVFTFVCVRFQLSPPTRYFYQDKVLFQMSGILHVTSTST